MNEIDQFNRLICNIESRCMAADGPVTPTLQEMTEDELSKIWHLLQTIKTKLAAI
jgi:hypothetical protein